LFENEQSQKEFCKQPKRYLKNPPQMPDRFRLLLSGPAGCGKKTVAKVLNDKYGWRIVDWNEIVTRKIDELRSRESHLPNNPLAEGYGLGLAEDEWNNVLEGKPIDAFSLLPWFYEFMGFKCEKRRPPPKVPENEEDLTEEERARREEVERKKEEERKNKEERKEKEKKKKEKEREKKKKNKPEEEEAEGEGEGENEEEPLEDLKIADIDIMVENEETLQKPFVGGFMLIGFPQTLEQIEKLKTTGVGFDKILHFVDTDEENPGATLKERMKHDEFYNLQRELENNEKLLGIYKEQYEDIVSEIPCNGTIDDVLARVYASIDPFYLRVDAPENVRTTEDLGEDDRPLPRGEYGNFCPVTFASDSWLYPGADENEVQVNERVYKVAGDKEAELFKANPGKYITAEGIQKPPEPHIMLIGPRGSGVSTQIELICQKYKVPEFKLKVEFLAKLKASKNERKKQRLLKRGFKPPEPVEEGEEGPPPDPEIEDDPDDFEKEAHEKETLKYVLDAYSPLIIDGEWFDLPDEEVATQYTDLLFDSRRPPEIVIHLSVSEDKMLDRLLDRNAIEAKYQELMDKRNEEK